MKYYYCLSCHRKHTEYNNATLLMCSCGEYEDNLLIEVDKEGRPVKKEVKEDGKSD